MKIVLLSFLYEPEVGGGAAVAVNRLAHSLIKKKYSVTVITTWNGKQIKIDLLDSIKVIRIPANNLYWVAEKDNQPKARKVFWQLFDIWNPITYQTVKQILSNEKPDVVHSHKLRGLSPSIWSAASSAGVKNIVHTCHDYELLSPEGLFMGRVGELAREQNLIMRPYQNLRRSFSKLVKIVTAPSQYVLDFHIKMGFFPSAIKQIIPNTHGYGVVESQQLFLQRANNKDPGTGVHFLYLGRLDRSKGVDQLCQAFQQIAYDKKDHILRIAGWGPLETYLREKYKDQSNIIFSGPVFGLQKEELFSDSDVLVSPSTVPESFGIAIVEAFSHGIPVIASRIGAFPEIIQEGKTGNLFDPGSVDGLASVLEKAIKNEIPLGDLSINCFEVAKKYSIDEITNRYLDVYGAIS